MYARTVGRKVRATAVASADELDGDVPNVGIGKALTVILVLHVLAIVAIVIGTGWGDKEPIENHSIVLDDENKSVSETGETTNTNRGTIYPDVPDSYNIDGAEGSENRAASVVSQAVESGGERELAAQPRRRRPRVIRPNRDPNKLGLMVREEPVVVASPVAVRYFEHKIKKGDNFSVLARRYKLRTQEIVDMNPAVDSRKMKIGMVVRIPKK